MNANQIVNMIFRTIIRRLVNGGIDAGFKAMSNKRGPSQDGDAAGQQKPPVTNSLQNGQQTKQAMRILKRNMRF